MAFPYLSVIVFTPAVAAVLILLLPLERKNEARMVAAAAGLVTMLLGLFVFFGYNIGAGGYQYVERVPWIPQLGIDYHVGADGISLPLVALTGVVLFTGVLISWGIEDRPRDFFAFLLLLVTGVFGVFVSLDLFLLFFFYELAVFPMYLLISIWGSTRKEYAAMKLTLYLFIGSVFALLGALVLYFSESQSALASVGLTSRTFDMLKIAEMQALGAFSPDFQRAWFLPVFLGFGVLAGLWPFHNWSPDGHVAAPTAVSMIHAGVLMKLGAFAALRVGIQLFPQGALYWLPLILLLTVVNVVYGASIAMVQRDFKYVIGFSSVSHMGLVTMGFATMTMNGLTGATYQMVSHGVMTALFFAVVGMVYDRAHTRDIPSLGGFARAMPLVAGAFIVGGLVSMGMPGLSGFMAELPIFLGLWDRGQAGMPAGANPAWAAWYPVVALLSALGIIITAYYIMRIIGQVFFGEVKPEFAHVGDVTVLDKLALGIQVALLVLLGVFPLLMVPLIQSGVRPILAALGVDGGG
jgi:NADH-quinone oxidoreductase subunit M